MPTIVNLPFQVEDGDVFYGRFDQYLIDWSECDADESDIDEMVLDSGHPSGTVRFEDNQPTEVNPT